MLIEKKYQKRLLCPMSMLWKSPKTYNELESHLSTKHNAEVEKEKFIFENMTCKIHYIIISNKLNVLKKYKLIFCILELGTKYWAKNSKSICGAYDRKRNKKQKLYS